MTTRDSRRGSGLALTAAGALALMAVLGLSLDFGRIYVARSELQTAADAMALAAARELDGSAGASHAAEAAARRLDNRWHFDSEPVSEPEFAYSNDGSASSWEASGTRDARFVRVRVEAALPMSFGRIFASGSLNPEGAMVVGAMAIATHFQAANLRVPVLPIAVQARGAEPWPEGEAVTVTPGANGQGSCGGVFREPRLFVPSDPAMPGSFDALAVRDWAIQQGVPAPSAAPDLTDWMDGVPERTSVRLLSETDQDGLSGLFSDYARLARGNGRRVVRVLAQSGAERPKVITVLLPPLSAIGEGPICGEYVSDALLAQAPWAVASRAGAGVRLVDSE